MQKLDNRLNSILNDSVKYAETFETKNVLLEHMLVTFLKDKNIKKELQSKKINVKKIISETEKYLKEYPLIQNNALEKVTNNKVLETFFAQYYIFEDCNEDAISDKDILFLVNVFSSFLVMEGTFAQQVLLDNDVNFEVLSSFYNNFEVFGKQMDVPQNKSTDIYSFASEIMQPSLGSTTKSNTKSYIKEISITKKEYDSFIGRKRELKLGEEIILRKDKPNLLIVGNNGVGKTSLAKQILYKSIQNGCKVYQLNVKALTSNILLKGEVETRVKNLCNDLLKDPKVEIILLIENIHEISSESESGSLASDISMGLEQYVSSGQMKIIGTTNFDNYQKTIVNDDFLQRSFHRLNLDELSNDETKQVVMKKKSLYEKHFGCKFSAKIIDLIIDCSNRYFPRKSRPEKVFDMIDMIGADAKHNNENSISELSVYRALSLFLNIPMDALSVSEEEKYKSLEQELKKKILGQDKAVEKVADSVIISRSGLREQNKTAISLLFTGSSGVGKTELCNTLSKVLNIPLVRIDMSEYMEEHSVSKLIGAPPGYKGFGDGKSGNGILINEIDEHPSCILLLDEIEKANSKIHNLLLQIMDNGLITSSGGKEVSFEQVFLIMTSNVGSRFISKQKIGFGQSDMIENEELDNTFLPEFRSRLDGIIQFNNLSLDIMKGITKKMLDELSAVIKKKNLNIIYNDDIINYIAEKSFNMNNGARNIKHIITDEIKNIIAKKIIFGEYTKNKKIELKMDNNKILVG